MHTYKTIAKLLTFKLTAKEMHNFNNRHLIIGVLGTWIVGVGRYWDDDKANILLHLGLSSVIYIFALALFIWLILLPYKLQNWNYFSVLTFIALTSFPAIFYAFPVERFFSIEIANSLNVWFLAIVALWRLLLLYYFLKHITKLSTLNILVVTLMPITVIIATLTALNLHRVVFNIMGGIRNPTPHDASYTILFLLTTISVFLVIPLIVGYIFGIRNSRKK